MPYVPGEELSRKPLLDSQAENADDDIHGLVLPAHRAAAWLHVRGRGGDGMKQEENHNRESEKTVGERWHTRER
jgi:hypothetical protein